MQWMLIKFGACTADACAEIFSGTAPFSEPETQAIRDAVLGFRGRLTAFISLHAYSQLWLYPFGHAMDPYPADISDLVGS